MFFSASFFSLSCYLSLFSTVHYTTLPYRTHHTLLYPPHFNIPPMSYSYSTPSYSPYPTLPLSSPLLSTIRTPQPSLPLPCRQRPALGKCLAAFSAAFPVAFLEHQINRFNSFSIYNSRGAKDRAGTGLCACICHTHSVIEFQHLGSWANRFPWPKCSLSFLFMHFFCSLTPFTAAVSFCLSALGLSGQVGDVCPLIPNLDKSLEEIMDLAESGMRYTQVPHVMEV